jgi:hypothetical protein
MRANETGGADLEREKSRTRLARQGEPVRALATFTSALRPQQEFDESLYGFVSRRRDLQMRKIRRVEDRTTFAKTEKRLAVIRAKQLRGKS